jgi:hypothetical protein
MKLYDVFYKRDARGRCALDTARHLPDPSRGIRYARTSWDNEYLVPDGGRWRSASRDEALTR